ncbi:MAG TPA: thiazole synthase [Candidatus Polarisedimenticolia bacterium]|nr:thiazole synthase [Candidatus Polarisedimenticolia bacterium]
MELGGVAYGSRLILGTGKYATPALMEESLEASGTEIVTVAVRRIDLSSGGRGSLLDSPGLSRYTILPNTAGCYSAEEAVRTALLARELGLSSLLKLEVIGDPRTLFPDVEGLLQATRVLVKEGFTVLPYTSDDLVIAKKLRDAGAAAIMPLGAPIGSGLGIQNRNHLRLLLQEIRDIPVIVDAGVGTASDAAIAMELGCDGVLMNTGVAGAKNPVQMARAMRMAVQAGRLAFEAGRVPRKLYASASSPEEMMIE